MHRSILDYWPHMIEIQLVPRPGKAKSFVTEVELSVVDTKEDVSKNPLRSSTTHVGTSDTNNARHLTLVRNLQVQQRKRRVIMQYSCYIRPLRHCQISLKLTQEQMERVVLWVNCNASDLIQIFFKLRCRK